MKKSEQIFWSVGGEPELIHAGDMRVLLGPFRTPPQVPVRVVSEVAYRALVAAADGEDDRAPEVYTADNVGHLGRVQVFLDGEEVAMVMEASPAQGYLIRYKRDECGKLVIEGDEVATERLEGVVEVKTQFAQNG